MQPLPPVPTATATLGKLVTEAARDTDTHRASFLSPPLSPSAMQAAVPRMNSMHFSPPWAEEGGVCLRRMSAVVTARELRELSDLARTSSGSYYPHLGDVPEVDADTLGAEGMVLEGACEVHRPEVRGSPRAGTRPLGRRSAGHAARAGAAGAHRAVGSPFGDLAAGQVPARGLFGVGGGEDGGAVATGDAGGLDVERVLASGFLSENV